MQVPLPRPRWWQRAVLRAAATRPVSNVLSIVLRRLDGLFLRLTRNKRSLTSLLTGLPVVRLTTVGAISGKPRTCPLIPLPDGECLVIFGTNFGSRRHPAWFHNLTANPDVRVSLNGTTARFVARQAEESERARYWPRAVAMYPGYAAYASRVKGRRIPIVVLTPVGMAEQARELADEERVDR